MILVSGLYVRRHTGCCIGGLSKLCHTRGWHTESVKSLKNGSKHSVVYKRNCSTWKHINSNDSSYGNEIPGSINKAGHCSKSWVNNSYSKTTLHHGVSIPVSAWREWEKSESRIWRMTYDVSVLVTRPPCSVTFRILSSSGVIRTGYLWNKYCTYYRSRYEFYRH